MISISVMANIHAIALFARQLSGIEISDLTPPFQSIDSPETTFFSEPTLLTPPPRSAGIETSVIRIFPTHKPENNVRSTVSWTR